MVIVPSGTFLMGSPNNEPEPYTSEGPQHRVTIPKPFAVGRFAVTFAEWDACVASARKASALGYVLIIRAIGSGMASP
ncbi:MAG: SUMF1/EgtB/PvdO family nonheme iron enzyme [Rhodomicrobium sp.]